MAARNNQVQPPPADHTDRGVFSLRAFIHDEAFGGILLLACAIVALVWANSPWKEQYEDLWNATLTLGTARFNLTETLLHWVNDGLMAIFFFVVGLEIKREVLVGELASPRRAALPVIAAIGGMLVPAAIYFAVNAGGAGEAGWGIPMATDIAFALGVLALLGDRVPIGLKVFLTALAIVDDILAVLVIALVYTSDVDWGALGLAGLVFAVLLAPAAPGYASQPSMVFWALRCGRRCSPPVSTPRSPECSWRSRFPPARGSILPPSLRRAGASSTASTPPALTRKTSRQ